MEEGNLCDLPTQQEQKSGTFLLNGAILQGFRTNPRTWELGWASLACHMVVELGAKDTSKHLFTSETKLELKIELEVDEQATEAEVDSAEEDSNTEWSWSFKFGKE